MGKLVAACGFMRLWFEIDFDMTVEPRRQFPLLTFFYRSSRECRETQRNSFGLTRSMCLELLA